MNTTGRLSPFGSRVLGSANQPVPVLRIRVQVLLTLLLVGTNVVGAAVVVGLLVLVIPGPVLTAQMSDVLLIAVPAYVCGGLVAGAWWGTWRALRVLSWALLERTPGARERADALRVTRELTAVQGLLWGGATVMFGILVGSVQPALLVTVPTTVSLGGIVVCANAYLLTEFALRPVVARALADFSVSDTAPPRAGSVGTRMLAFWCLGTAVPTSGLIGVAGLVLLRGGVTANRLAITVIGLGGVVLVFGLLLTFFAVRSVVAPLSSVREALEQVRRGRCDVHIEVYDGTEMGVLQTGVNRMTQGLREREHIRDLFGRHVGNQVVTAALQRSAETGEVELGGEVRDVSVLFVDLIGSTALAATRPPADVVESLNHFFALVVAEVNSRGGLVNKFVGDAVLAVFGAPTVMPDHATVALVTARSIARRLSKEMPDVGAGIGVSSGSVIAGNIGDRNRFEYTVIGDPANEAARITELAKAAQGRLLAANVTVRRADRHEAEKWLEIDTVTLRGRNKPTILAAPCHVDH